MTLTLEQFIQAIEALKQTEEKNSLFNKAMEEISSSWFVSELAYPATEALVTLLEIIFDDKDGWINWWLYETKYGTRKDLTATDKDGNVIPTDTIEDLYNILTDKKV